MRARCSGTPRAPGRPRDALPAPGAARCRRSRAQHQGQIPVSAGGAREMGEGTVGLNTPGLSRDPQDPALSRPVPEGCPCPRP